MDGVDPDPSESIWRHVRVVGVGVVTEEETQESTTPAAGDGESLGACRSLGCCFLGPLTFNGTLIVNEVSMVTTRHDPRGGI